MRLEEGGGRVAMNRNESDTAKAILESLEAWPGGENSVVLACESVPFSVRQVKRAMQNRVAEMKDAGVEPGDKVLLATGRGNAYWCDLFAIWMIGAVAIPVESRLPPARLRTVAELSRPQWLIGSMAAPMSGTLSVQTLPDHPFETDAVKENSFDAEALAPERPALVLFTSGTTGEPKGVPLSHGAILGNARATQAAVALPRGDRLVSCIPFRYVSALSHALVSLLSHVTYCGYERSLPQPRFCDLLAETRCSAYGGSPLQARWIAARAERFADQGRAAFDSLRWLMSSGDYLAEDVIERLRKYLPNIRLIVAYGLTEAAGRICCRTVSACSAASPGRVGRPISGMRVTVRRDDFTICKPHETGLVYVEGEYMFDEYVGASQPAQTPVGKYGFCTRDVGHLDDHDELILSGRADDIFKLAGQKVSSVPIAAALMETGFFSDVAVIPEVHRRLGHVPHVYYVAEERREVSTATLMQRLRERLPSSHVPKRFTAVRQIPRTGSGKVDRVALRECRPAGE